MHVFLKFVPIVALSVLPFSGCIKKIDSSSVTGSNSELHLEPTVSTYFKKSTAQIKDTPSMPRCGLKKGKSFTLAKAPMPASVPAAVAAKYYYGKLIAFSGQTFDVVGDFCNSQENGFIFKDYVKFASAASVVEPTQEVDQDPIVEPGLDDGQVVDVASPESPSLPSYSPVVELPAGEHGAYIQSRANALLNYYNSESAKKAQGNYTPPVYIMAVPRAGVTKTKLYSLSGNFRINGKNRPTLDPIYDNGTLDFSSVNFREWEGNSSQRILMPLQQSSFSADSCDTRSNGGQVSSYSVGSGMTPCDVPPDGNGLYWIWFDCSEYEFIVQVGRNGAPKKMGCTQ